MFGIRRREFISAARRRGGAWPLAARAQQPGEVRRVGMLDKRRDEQGTYVAAFREGLRELGYVEGKTSRSSSLERRRLEGSPQLAAELVGLRCDVIVTRQHTAGDAAKQATSAIPIVFAAVTDPVSKAWLRAWKDPVAT